ncbi:hypothetical protein M441DRAFT_59127 [Trichoderma asperellum CBS 433.97]|uniref:Uncharacterized protein n=1 Tax=Trichoderma asperellum (strain ATCC 204424 / CBS 433.97 / NBRC 101777) TaxID=1042311 RepID=A0A2T3Z6I3_TRIA4|nr:hypothetical protein M441DRAFT_59127 [Trichoderma asperellum CBS 433.97]PTB40360.1 hypothetical protein M441DRAFT_59127 [Trichoderma asperellum CBS 433.97]
MALEMAIDSMTIRDIIRILKGFNPQDKFQTVLNTCNDDSFDHICNVILRAIFRCASQSKTTSHNENLPRTYRIQQIAREEHIIPEEHTKIQDTTLENSLSPDRSITQEHTETQDQDTTLENSLSPDRSVTHEHTEIQGQDTTSSSPDRATECTSILNNTLSEEQCSLPENSSAATASDSAIELSDILDDENIASPNEISADQTTAEGQKSKQKLPPNYPTLTTSVTASREFPGWSREPKKFWAQSKNAPSFKGQNTSARCKVFVQHAINSIDDTIIIQTLQDRFTSILVYQSYRKLMGGGNITSNNILQYLQRLGIPAHFAPDCSRLVFSGKRREKFCHDIDPDRHEIDYSSQLIPDLKDKLFTHNKDSRMATKCAKTVTTFKDQKDTLLWLASSKAQSAAKAILSYGQKLLGLEEHAHTGYDRPNGQKRRIELEEETGSFKRIRTSVTRSPAGFQNSSPNTHQNATISQRRLHDESPNITANPAVFQVGRDSPLDSQSNGQGLETLAQVALTNIPSEEATNFISNEGTIHSESASYRENAPSDQNRPNLRTEINNLAPSQPNDNPPSETNDDIQRLSSYQDNTATGDFHEQCHASWQARTVEENDDGVYNSEINWESIFTTVDNIDWGTGTIE